MTEWEFLNEVVERADCGILLDVNNIYVSPAITISIPIYVNTSHRNGWRSSTSPATPSTANIFSTPTIIR